jgi:hypothetical protein
LFGRLYGSSRTVSPLEEDTIRILRYSITVTLDGCCDHRAGVTDAALHRHWAENRAQAAARRLGRVLSHMLAAAWRPPASDARPDWTTPVARTIAAAQQDGVARTLERVDWNAARVRGDRGEAVQQRKREPGKGRFVGGVQLPLALAERGLIDAYECVVQPRRAGHGPTLRAGRSQPSDVKRVRRLEFGSGAILPLSMVDNSTPHVVTA